jgi:hypothetical protein
MSLNGSNNKAALKDYSRAKPKQPIQLAELPIKNGQKQVTPSLTQISI